MTKVVSWDELNFDTKGATLLLGNGASIAVSDRFNYKSLYEKAQLAKAERAVFDALSTCDFERVLRALAETDTVSAALGRRCDTRATLEKVRRALITVVQSTHPEPEKVRDALSTAAVFSQRFDTIVSFNYDLLVYWMLMAANANDQVHRFKDCFDGNGTFIGNKWSTYRESLAPYKRTTLVFYAHGAAFLAQTDGSEVKLSGDAGGLADVIARRWIGGDLPLFVSEGDADSKLSVIGASDYLRTVFFDVLPKAVKGRNIVAYGLGFKNNDKHIVAALAKAPPKRLAVSVWGASEVDRQNEVLRIEALLRKQIPETETQIDFFDASSAGCWIHPPMTAP